MVTTQPTSKLIKHVSRKAWWHVPPVDPDAFNARGKFYSSTYREAEFYGNPGDSERVMVRNPLVGDEDTIEMTLFGKRCSEAMVKIQFTLRFYKARCALDARIKRAALRKGYDSVILMPPAGFSEYARSGKIPRSIELNVLVPEEIR